MIIIRVKELKKYGYLLLGLILMFFISLSIEYSKYKDFKYEELYENYFLVLNIYKKEKFNILKLKNKDFVFFSKFKKNIDIKKGDSVSLGILTLHISFLDFLKGFYTKTIYFEKVNHEESLKEKLVKTTDSQHHNEMISEFYNALFFANPISKELRQICTNYGISHLLALSGFHLAILGFIIYWLVYFPYKYFHQKYFPYRNRKFDILLMSSFILLCYLIFTDFVPSLLRAFIMMILGIYFLRHNIKIFSFLNLSIVFLLVIVFFPTYLFSLGFWFSILAVFYILLFVKYFTNFRNKVIQILFFNFWIFFAMNPIIHFFFSSTTTEQLLSPILSIFFIIFYIPSLFAHFFDIAYIFDDYLVSFFSYQFSVYQINTNFNFFVAYLLISFLSVFFKYAFYFLNFLVVIFNIFLYI